MGLEGSNKQAECAPLTSTQGKLGAGSWTTSEQQGLGISTPSGTNKLCYVAGSEIIAVNFRDDFL